MDLRIDPIERFDLNVTAGLVNTIKERDISEVIIGMHRKATVVDSFFGSKIEQLIKSTNKMVLITRCFIPVNAVTRIVVVVPQGRIRDRICPVGQLARSPYTPDRMPHNILLQHRHPALCERSPHPRPV